MQRNLLDDIYVRCVQNYKEFGNYWIFRGNRDFESITPVILFVGNLKAADL
jgi:hypothetical protein